MEVDTESTNTSVEDKTEDFCDNPTRDALTEGLMRLFKPTIDQLDEKVRTIRISQIELKQQIESLSDELKKINESSSDKEVDLDVYVKKLMTVKHKVTVVSNILQNSEERLLKLQQNINKDSTSRKALLETASVNQKPDSTIIFTNFNGHTTENIKMHKIDTPSLVHTTNSDWLYVYEPAEDTFLLLDTLENDMDFIMMRKPKICLEVGSGSGVVITGLSKALNFSTHCLAIDVNKHACKLTLRTSIQNNAAIDVIQGDLTSCLRNFSVDLIVFNPPYVLTPSEELKSEDCLTRSWAGGCNGREVIDRFLSTVHDVLTSKGFGYILLLKENDPSSVIDILSRKNMNAQILGFRKIRSEELYVVKFQMNEKTIN